MRPNFLEGHFHLPAQEEPLEDLSGRLVEVGAQQSSRFELAFGVPYDDPTDGHRKQPTVVPDCGAGGDLDHSRAVAIPGQASGAAISTGDWRGLAAAREDAYRPSEVVLWCGVGAAALARRGGHPGAGA